MSSQAKISPSDIGQSYVRIAVVGLLGVWIISNETSSVSFDVTQSIVALSWAGYFVYSIFFLYASYYLDRADLGWEGWVHLKRSIGLFSDLISCGIFLYFGGSYGPSIYPIYIIIIVGYGLRYGFPYLLLAMSVAWVTFFFSANNNPVFKESESLMIGCYLGLILIPGYAAILLKKYQDLLRRLSETNAARARFIANMSHELRTPLHAIIGNAEVLSARLAELERRDTDFAPLSTSAKMVTEASEHLRALVDGVLDIASNDAGTFVLGEPREVDLYRLVRSAVGISSPGNRKPGLTVQWHIDPRVPRVVETWEQHLKAVLINTIGNAVKYTNSGTINVTVEVAPYASDAASATLLVNISDTGIGIPTEQFETIFEPFAIGDDSRARRFEGTGLGLTITKQYLDEMRGRIEIDSTEGIGTRVKIEIPMKLISGERPRPVHPARAVVVAQPGSRDRLLSWLEGGDFLCHSVAWDGHCFVGNPITLLPDVVFVAEHYLHEAEKITRYAAALLGDAIPVLVGDPGRTDPHGPFVTSVELDNDAQLRNIFSLLDPGLSSNPARTGARYNVLVVDDNETNLQSAQIALESFGHTVVTIDNGSEALAILRDQSFDLVFMDMHMPGLSGLEVSTMYANEAKTPVPVVILTADATRTATADAEIPEVVGFLTKPIKPCELQHALERYAVKQPAGDDEIPALPDPRASLAGEQAFSRESYVELLKSGAEPSVLEALVDRFVEDALEIINGIKRAASAGDPTEAKRLLHKLKGSAGAMHIGGLIAVVESFDRRDGDELRGHIAKHAATLEASVLSTGAEIRQFVFHETNRMRA